MESRGLTLRAEEVHAVVVHHPGADLIGGPEFLQGAQRLIIDVGGAWKRIQIGEAVDGHGSYAPAGEQSGERHAHRPAADDRHLISGGAHDRSAQACMSTGRSTGSTNSAGMFGPQALPMCSNPKVPPPAAAQAASSSITSMSL